MTESKATRRERLFTEILDVLEKVKSWNQGKISGEET